MAGPGVQSGIFWIQTPTLDLSCQDFRSLVISSGTGPFCLEFFKIICSSFGGNGIQRIHYFFEGDYVLAKTGTNYVVYL